MWLGNVPIHPTPAPSCVLLGFVLVRDDSEDIRFQLGIVYARSTRENRLATNTTTRVLRPLAVYDDRDQ